MTKTAKTVSPRPAPTEPAATAPDDGRLKVQAFAAPDSFAAGTHSSGARRANWELRALGALGFELASAQG